MARQFVSAEEAVQIVESQQRVFIQGACATPQALVRALTSRAPELRNVELTHIHTEGEAPYAAPEYKESFFINSLFVGGNVRQAIKEGRGQYIPIFLSEIPYLFKQGVLPLNVAMIQVSPPDRHGFCSLGTSVDITVSAIHNAQHVIAQVNEQMPRTHGDGLIHIKALDAMVESHEALPEIHPPELSEIQRAIGCNCAELIEDGATLQMGIGAIPDAVLAALTGHARLGVHTEMFSDGVIDLVEKGIITGEEKKIHPGKIVAGFVMGTRRLYDFIDDNPLISLIDIAYVNDTDTIRQNPKATAINSALEVDLTGQVCADSIGNYQYSGVGGQMDFIRGASRSKGGKPIIALPATTRKGQSRIVPYLKQGAGVVTTRAHVHYIVTEYGVANLYGKNLKQRAEALIQIAHPDHREALEKSAFERFHC